MQEEFEDTKGVIRIRISEKDRQNNGQKKRTKEQTANLQNTTQKTKDRTTRNTIKTGSELKRPGMAIKPAPPVVLGVSYNDLVNVQYLSNVRRK